MTKRSTPSNRSGRGTSILLGVVVLMVVAGGGYWLWQRRSAASTTVTYSLIRPQRGAISAMVSATGSMQPRKVVNLSFAVPGSVAAIVVEAGQSIEAGTPLARLDGRLAQLQVASAQAVLDQAKANYSKLMDAVQPTDVKQAEAQVRQAQAQLTQAQASVTADDITAAQAALEQAQTNLSLLEAGADSQAIAAAQAILDQAQANLENQRNLLSSAKTKADGAVQVAANQLRNSQDNYQRIYWNNRQLDAQGLPVLDLEHNREAEALRTVESNQVLLDQAQVAYAQAQQAEVNGLAVAEAQVRNAQATLNQVRRGPTEAQIATAHAQVAQAEANLARLKGGQHIGSVAAAAALVDGAQANLERLTAGPRSADLAIAQAQIRQAETALKQAQFALDGTTLVSPISGVVAEINLTEGAPPVLNRPAVVVADFSRFHVDVSVDEIDVAQLALGQPVTLTLDAIPDLALVGKVARIDALANEQGGVTSYGVQVETAASDPRVRPGMSANVEVEVARKEAVLMVPLRAVRLDGAQYVVDLLADPGLCAVDPAKWPATPTLRTVEITTGLSNDAYTEIVTGDVSTASCLSVEGFDARLNLLNGTRPPSLRERRQQGS